MSTTCAWLEDRCERPAAGDAAHPVHGVIPICTTHQRMFSIPLITVHATEGQA